MVTDADATPVSLAETTMVADAKSSSFYCFYAAAEVIPSANKASKRGRLLPLLSSVLYFMA